MRQNTVRAKTANRLYKIQEHRSGFLPGGDQGVGILGAPKAWQWISKDRTAHQGFDFHARRFDAMGRIEWIFNAKAGDSAKPDKDRPGAGEADADPPERQGIGI